MDPSLTATFKHPSHEFDTLGYNPAPTTNHVRAARGSSRLGTDEPSVPGQSWPGGMPHDDEGQDSTTNDLPLLPGLGEGGRGDEGKLCAATKPNNQPCNAYRLKTSAFCVYHDPNYHPELRKAAARGGAAYRRIILGPEAILADLGDRSDIAIGFQMVFRLQLSGAISYKRCAQMLRNLSAAERNLTGMQRDKFGTTEHFGDAYKEREAAALEALPVIAGLLESDELEQRIHAIADAGSRVEEVIKIKERWKDNPNRDTTSIAFKAPAYGDDDDDDRDDDSGDAGAVPHPSWPGGPPNYDNSPRHSASSPPATNEPRTSVSGAPSAPPPPLAGTRGTPLARSLQLQLFGRGGRGVRAELLPTPTRSHFSRNQSPSLNPAAARNPNSVFSVAPW